MGDLRELVVKILGDTNDFDKKMSSAGSKIEKFGTDTIKVGAGLTAGLTLPIIGMGIAAVKAASDAEAHLKQTESVIKSTGGTAGVTVGHVNDLAASVMRLTGADDDTVVAGENMLLTFTNIKAQGGIFDRATGAALDLATAMNNGVVPSAEEVQAQALQIGKALNDPITGYTKLQRIGVTFTEDQIKQIKTLEKNGDMMGAQKVILDELAKEFGGSAASAGQTFQGKIALLSNTLGNLAETVGGVLLPKLTELATKATPCIEQLTNAVSNLSPSMLLIIVAVLGAAAALGPLLIILGSLITAVGAVLPVIGAVATFLAGPFLLPVLAVVAGVALLVAGIVLLATHWQQITAAIAGSPAFPILQAVLAAVWSAFQNVASIVAAQVAPILSQLQTTIQTQLLPAWTSIVAAFETAKPFLIGIAAVIGGVLVVAFGLAISVIAGLAGALGGLISGIIGFLAGIIQAVSGFVQLFVGWFRFLIGIVTGLFTGDWSGMQAGLEQMKAGALGIWNGIKFAFVSLITGLIGAVGGLIQGFVSTIVGYFTGLWDKLVGHSIIPDLVNGIVSWIAQLPGRVGAIILSLISTGIALFNSLHAQAVSLVQSMVNTVVSVAARLQSALTAPIQAAKDIIGGILGGLQRLFSGLSLQLPHIKLPHFKINGSFSLNPPSVPTLGIDWYAKGGIFNEPSIIGVGEKGAEAVVPLDRLDSAGGGRSGERGGDVVIELDGREIVRAFAPYLVDELRRSGAIRGAF